MAPKNQQPSSHSLAVRILAIALAVLVAGGVVTYIGWFIMNLIG